MDNPVKISHRALSSPVGGCRGGGGYAARLTFFFRKSGEAGKVPEVTQAGLKPLCRFGSQGIIVTRGREADDVLRARVLLDHPLVVPRRHLPVLAGGQDQGGSSRLGRVGERVEIVAAPASIVW